MSLLGSSGGGRIECSIGLALLFLVVGCGVDRVAANPVNVVLIVIDTLGDRIWRGCDGTRTVAEINRQLSGQAEAPPAAEMGLILRQTLLRLFQLNLIDFPEGSPYGSFETMPIDLRQVTFYVINCTGATARRAFISSTCWTP